MAISTYAELQTAVTNYLDHTNLDSARIEEFISITENRINRKIRLSEQHQLSTATYSNGSRFIEVPSDQLEIITLEIKKATEEDTEYEPLKYEAPERIYMRYSDSDGTPEYYTYRDQFEFEREADVDHTLRIHYTKRWDIATDSTNWLLTNYEEIYLYGALVVAEPYIRNDERIIFWKSQFEEAMKELEDLDMRNKDDAVLHCDSALVGRNRFNITTGSY